MTPSSLHYMGLGPAKAPGSPAAANTGHVSEVYESPHTRGAVKKHQNYCEEIRSTWRGGGNASEETIGKKGS